MSPAPPLPLASLLAAAIDYAGLFPPAALPMAEAVDNYAAYLHAPDCWALGRFIVPAPQLDAYRQARLAARDPQRPWRLSVLSGPDPAAAQAAIAAFLASSADVVEALEMPVASPADAAQLPPDPSRERFCEVNLAADGLDDLLVAIRIAGVSAKVRTGGLTPAAIPAAPDLVRFLARCVKLALPFKATAGLHHPFRGVHALTADPAGPVANMYGYVGLILATAVLVADPDALDDALASLEVDGRADFRIDGRSLHWRGRDWALPEIAAARQLFRSFGSCSFIEPLADLRHYGLL